MNHRNEIDEDFVREICKDPIWKTARVDVKVSPEAIDEGLGSALKTGAKFVGSKIKKGLSGTKAGVLGRKGTSKQQSSLSFRAGRKIGGAVRSGAGGVKAGLKGQDTSKGKGSGSLSRRAGGVVGRGIRKVAGGIKKRVGAVGRALVTGEMTETEAREALYEIFDEYMAETVSEETVAEMVDMLFEPLMERTIAAMVEEGSLELEDEE